MFAFFCIALFISNRYMASSSSSSAVDAARLVGSKTPLQRRLWLAAKYAMRFRQLILQGDTFFKSLQNAYVLRDALLESGPLFVKLGQWMSQRPDLFSPAFSKVLSELQAQVPPHSWSATEQALKRAFPHLHDPVTQLFLSIERDSMASGSVAQVHRARAKRSVLEKCAARVERISSEARDDDNNDERKKGVREGARVGDDDEIVDVVVKVRHPNAREEFIEGLDALSVLFAAGRACGVLVFSIVRFEDMARDMMSQLDLRGEATAMRDMRANFANNAFVAFPTPFLATEEVLVESFEDGISYEDIGTACDANRYDNETERDLCRDQCKHLTLAAYLQMTLHDGLIHGDCHNGNIVYRIQRKTESEIERERQTNPDKTAIINPFRVRICFLDFGIVLRFNEVVRRNHLRITVNMNSNNGAAVAENMRELMIEAGQYNEAAYRRFKVDCIACVNQLERTEQEKNTIPISHVMSQIMGLLHKYRLVIDATTGRMMVGFVLIEQGRDARRYNGISITESTMRWLLFEDAGENFPLVPYIGHIMGAKMTRTQSTPIGALPPIIDPTVERDVLQAKENALTSIDLETSLSEIGGAGVGGERNNNDDKNNNNNKNNTEPGAQRRRRKKVEPKEKQESGEENREERKEDEIMLNVATTTTTMEPIQTGVEMPTAIRT